MRRAVPTMAALLAAWLLQAGLAPYIAIGGVAPNLLLLVAITLALAEGPAAGCVAGFAAGLLFDLLGSGPVGAAALVFCLVGYFAGLLHRHMFAEGWLLPLTVLAVGGLSAELAYWLVLSVLNAGGPFWSSLGHVILPGAVYTLVLGLLLYPWLARFLRQDRPMPTFRRLA